LELRRVFEPQSRLKTGEIKILDVEKGRKKGGIITGLRVSE